MNVNEQGRVRVTDPEAINLMGAQMLVVARMGAGDDDTVLIRSRMTEEPRMVPLHAHADVECFYVLSGRLDVYLDGDEPGWRMVGAGQSLTVPGNVKHAVRNASGAPVDSILATTVRIARFFREIGQPGNVPAPAVPTAVDLARVRERATAYGYWLASPDENAELTR